MITTPAEYRNNLWQIQTNSFPRKAVLPYAERIYNIDLKTRVIESPEFLSVAKDHKAESIYFSVPRYVDYMDLSQTACVIQYKLEDGTLGLYPVPFYDITSQNTFGSERIIFPWLLDGLATAKSGIIEYSIRFFRVSDGADKRFIYNLNTIPAKSKILYGMDVQSEDTTGKFDVAPDLGTILMNELKKLQQSDIYWLEIK